MPDTSAEDAPGKGAKRFQLSRISLRLALRVATAAFVLLVAGYAAGALGTTAGVVGISLGIGLVTYLLTDRLLRSRLDLARTTLKQVRKHQFENLEAAHIPRGDELNALIWQVYRTGLALEKEIHELKKVENYRREFLGNVSHELKTPIFAIQGFAETLLDGALDDERVRRSFVEKILRNTSRLQHLTRDLNELTKIETGELKMTMGPFSLARVVGEIVESLEARAEERGVTIRVRVPETLPPAYGDRERIRQVITNLVDNALKYNVRGGFVEVEAAQLSPEELRLTVADSGIGLAPQHLPRLTERFFRVDKSRSREQGGTGLGLAIVKHILAAHERKLLVESRLGQGSTFGFSLPVARQ